MTKQTGILGAGVSGLAAARWLHSRGEAGWCASEKDPGEARRRVLDALGFPWREDLPDQQPDDVIVSPGIPWGHDWLVGFREAGIPVVPEFELGAAALEGDVVAVTGSLGKTTMVQLAQRVLSYGGRRVTVSGNSGVPVCDVAATTAVADIHLIELSSFQLEAVQEFTPQAAVCLNLFANHLDRHGSMQLYAKAKARLFAGLGEDAVASWPEEYPVEVACRARRVYPDPAAAPSLEGTPFAQGPWRENLVRLMAVLDPWLEDPQAALKYAVEGFTPPPHRMQELDIPGAGRVVDDSKSTCLNATIGAIKAVPGTLHLIMGGLGKGEDLSVLSALFAEREVFLYLIGDAAVAMEDAWKGQVAGCENCETLSRAIGSVWKRRDASQPLLFSPGCASFDQFTDYAVRGQEFQRLVTQLASQQPLNETPRRT